MYVQVDKLLLLHVLLKTINIINFLIQNQSNENELQYGLFVLEVCTINNVSIERIEITV